MLRDVNWYIFATFSAIFLKEIMEILELELKKYKNINILM